MINQKFICNICGEKGFFNPKGDWRESPTCIKCSSSVRSRHIAYCVSSVLLGSNEPLYSQPKCKLIGIGLSDSENLECVLSKVFDYTNTYYHRSPQLDICSLPAFQNEVADFLISSDVFEHVANPYINAFTGSYNILKKGGLFVLTVPYDAREKTTEHFPDIKNFSIMQFENEWLLVGKTWNNDFQIYNSLVFHGGPGTTVEMRVFSKNDVLKSLKESAKGSVPHIDIFFAENWRGSCYAAVAGSE